MISRDTIKRMWPVIAVLGVLLLVAGVGWRAYSLGYSQAAAEGQAAIAGLRTEYAEAMAKAERAARERLQAQITRANDVAATLEAERAKHNATLQIIKGRIADVTHGSTYSFGDDFVRLCNEAVGAGPGSIHIAGDPGDAEDSAATRQAVSAGVLADVPVTEADLLAWLADYGQRCRDIEAQLQGWIDLAKTWEDSSAP